MKVFQAVMLASVCALTTAGYTSAPLLDVERSVTNVIVAATPTTETATTDAVEPAAVDNAPAGTFSAVTEAPTTTITEAPTTTIAETPTMTTLADTPEMATTTVVEPIDSHDGPGVLQGPITPRP